MGTVCFAKENALRALYLAGTQATRAYVSGSVSTAGNDLNSSDVGFPSSVGSSVGMGNSLTESNALSANFTLCHSYYLQCALRAKHHNNPQIADRIGL